MTAAPSGSGSSADVAAVVAPPVNDRFGRPLRDLRMSVTDRCNLRCTYCLPPGADRPEFIEQARLLSFEQLTAVARACVGLGVRKIRLTGGEPLLRRHLQRLVKALAEIAGLDDLALTTNGLLLAGQAAALAGAGLGRVTVSLDSLDDEVFGRMNGLGVPVAGVLAGIRAARAAGLGPIKINTVIRRGLNDAGIVPLARFARDEGLILRLIEFMDVGPSDDWRIGDVVPADEMLAAVATAFPLAPAEPTPGMVATRYRYLDGGGELGIISAISRPFCGQCSRARLTADGHLYTCLFAGVGHDLRQSLLNGADPRETISAIWAARDDRYSAMRSVEGPGRRSVQMHRVGG